MAIYASTSTITTQTVPLIIVDPSTVSDEYFLIYDSSVGAFVAQKFKLPENYEIDFNKVDIVGTLSPVNGGTGISNYNKGDLLYGNEVDGDIVLDKLTIGSNNKVLVSFDDVPVWKALSEISDLETIKGVVSTENTTITTVSKNIGNTLPASSQITKIILMITEEYDSGDITVGTATNTSDIFDFNTVRITSPGLYTFAVDKFYTTPVQLYIAINNATTGAGKIIIEFIAE